MEKKEKHITINLKESEYVKLEEIANDQERTITNICYLLITKALKDKGANYGTI